MHDHWPGFCSSLSPPGSSCTASLASQLCPKGRHVFCVTRRRHEAATVYRQGQHGRQRHGLDVPTRDSNSCHAPPLCDPIVNAPVPTCVPQRSMFFGPNIHMVIVEEWYSYGDCGRVEITWWLWESGIHMVTGGTLVLQEPCTMHPSWLMLGERRCAPRVCSCPAALHQRRTPAALMSSEASARPGWRGMQDRSSSDVRGSGRLRG
ncbi:hypothetical protein NDU88_000207 [Pleurodeles waltl]|uniref:Uncharacterized protein n=1 Tax=Pleurodeles waltl TaxID=8319 RepID=A0AAV7KWS8_PLEWA|nr:hypothetical protein NDU88_000207 [Pleurodeles waltl]